MERETRIFSVEGLRVERRAEGGDVTLFGLAAPFNSRSENLGGFVEVIAPGAFTETIKSEDQRCLFDHDTGLVLGRRGAGTLLLKETARGLEFECRAANTPTNNDRVFVPVERGDIPGCSFAFSVRPGGQDWAEADDGTVVRTLKSLRVYEVSIVSFPAYSGTDVGVREFRSFLEAREPKPNLLLARARQQHAES